MLENASNTINELVVLDKGWEKVPDTHNVFAKLPGIMTTDNGSLAMGHHLITEEKEVDLPPQSKSQPYERKALGLNRLLLGKLIR